MLRAKRHDVDRSGRPDWDPRECAWCRRFMDTSNVETFAVEVAEQVEGETAYELLVRFMRLYHRRSHRVPR